MAGDEKIILDVKLSYDKGKLKNKAISGKNLAKKQASLNKEEQKAVDAELKELEQQEAEGAVKTHRQNNLIFVTDQPNFNTRKKCPVAVAVPNTIFNAQGGLTSHTIRPAFQPDNKITFEAIRYPDYGAIPYIFNDKDGKIYPKVQLETAIQHYPYSPFNNSATNRRFYPEYEPYVFLGVEEDCLKPIRQYIFENKPTFGYNTGFDILLPVRGSTAIYIKYQRYWYSYFHKYYIEQNQVRFSSGCYYEVEGSRKIIRKAYKKEDLWKGVLAKAFLIDPENVKEITLPSKVKDALKKITGEPLYRARTQTMFKENDTILTEPYYDYDNPPWKDPIYNPIDNEQYFPGLLWGYGFGTYDSTLHNSVDTFSPAIYDFLNVYAGEQQGQDLIEDYDTIKELYDPKPTAFLTTTDTRVEPDPNNLSTFTVVTDLLYTKTRPSNITLPLEEDTEKTFILRKPPNQIRVKYNQAIGLEETPLYAWDWGQPAYCYSEARKLGFSDEDLRFD